MDTYAPQGPRVGGAEARPKPGPGRLARWFILVALVLAVVVGALYWFNQYRTKTMAQFFATNAPPPMDVAVVVAESETMPRYLSGVGSLEAVRQVTISPEVDGRVIKIAFESGDTVQRGDFLVQLDDGPERGDLQTFEAQLQLAEVNLKRAEALAKKEFGTQANVDQNISARDQAKAGIAKTQALIAQKRINAPFGGNIGVRQINLGQYLQAGAPVVTLTNLDTLYANFTLPEQARSQVAVGQTVEIRADAYAGRVFQGRVTTIEPQVDPDTRNITVQAALDNPDHELLPGMYAQVQVVLPGEPDVVTLPETAVYNSVYGETVFLVQEQAPAEGAADSAPADDAGGAKESAPLYKVVETFVTTGTHYNGKVGIIKGIAAGDRVVKDGQVRLHNGAQVTIKSKPDPLQIPAKVPLD